MGMELCWMLHIGIGQWTLHFLGSSSDDLKGYGLLSFILSVRIDNILCDTSGDDFYV